MADTPSLQTNGLKKEYSSPAALSRGCGTENPFISCGAALLLRGVSGMIQ
jgi:hypothetical protein